MKLATLLAFATLVGCNSDPMVLRIGALSDEPAPTVIEILATSLSEAGYSVSIRFFESGADLMAAVDEGSLDLALIEEPRALAGNVTMLLPVYPSVLHVLQRQPPGSDLREILAGRIFAGPSGSFSRQLIADLADQFAVTETRLLDNPWTEPADAFFVFGGLLPKDSLRQLVGFELSGIAASRHGRGESLIDAIALRYPNLRPFVLPADVYPGLSHEPIPTLAITTLLVARASLDDEVAFRVVERLIENSRPVRAVYPLAYAASVKAMDLDSFALPLHTGSRRYFERNAPGFIERYVDVIALVMTIVLTGASGAIGWVHRRRRARKERVDRYLIAVRGIRKALRAGRAIDTRADIDSIESEVLDLVANEKIEVDAGLIAFLQLCASVRTEIPSSSAVLPPP